MARLGEPAVAWPARLRQYERVRSPPSEVFRATANIKFAAVTLTGLWLIVCVTAATAEGVSAWARAVAVAIGMVGVAGGARWSASRVQVDGDSVAIIGIVRRRVIPRTSVITAELVSPLLWTIPRLILRDAQAITIGFVCESSGRPGRATALVQRLANQ